MSDRAGRPLLFLDVDGPLLPFGEDPQRAAPGASPGSRLARLTSELGSRLAAPAPGPGTRAGKGLGWDGAQVIYWSGDGTVG